MDLSFDISYMKFFIFVAAVNIIYSFVEGLIKDNLSTFLASIFTAITVFVVFYLMGVFDYNISMYKFSG